MNDQKTTPTRNRKARRLPIPFFKVIKVWEGCEQRPFTGSHIQSVISVHLAKQDAYAEAERLSQEDDTPSVVGFRVVEDAVRFA